MRPNAIRALLPYLLAWSLCLASAAGAGRARLWQQHTYEDFAKGESQGVSVAAEGTLQLGPALTDLADLEAERIWSLVRNPKGGLYVGTGDGGRLFAIDSKGQARLLFDSPELVLHALAVAPDGTLYAGSAPDGLIYKIDAKGRAETLGQTGSHYVWALVFDAKGQLYAGTGEPGQVLKVAQDGEHEVLFDPEDHHVMTLLARGNRLYAGTSGKGRIYAIDAEGQARLLFEAAQEEIHDLVADAEGRLFASAIPARDKDEEQTKVPAAVYRVEEDGAVYAIWEDDKAVLVNLAADGENLALSASEPARLLRLGADGHRALAVQFEDFAPSRLLFGPDGALYLGGTQKAAVKTLPGKSRDNGHFDSAVEDFSLHARWGALEWRGNQPEGTRIAFKTRTGNSEEADDTWSPWSAPLTRSGQSITSPPARFVQYRVELESERDGRTPSVEWVAVRGVQANLRPRITEVKTFPFRTQKSGNSGQGQGTAPNIEGRRGGNRPPQAKSLRMVRWQATDPNEDELVYDIYLRGENQSEWKLAQENLLQNSIMWDTESMPEGWTRLKLVASDRADNPESESLSDERESAPFAIDNSPPHVQLEATTTERAVDVEVAISDRISAVQKAYYTVDYGDAQHHIAPLDGIFDSREEEARFTVEDLEPGEHVISVMVIDALDNVGVQQLVIRIE